MAATFTKLKNGDWGIKVDGKPGEGSVVTVSKKDGSTSQETVAKVLWSSNGVSICAIVAKPRKESSGSGSRSYGQQYGSHKCKNGHAPHPGPCCTGRHGGGTDCGCDCCDLD